MKDNKENIEDLWKQKNYRIEYRKKNVVLVDLNGGRGDYYIPKTLRGEDYSYDWELQETFNVAFPNEKVKFKSELRK